MFCVKLPFRNHKLYPKPPAGRPMFKRQVGNFRYLFFVAGSMDEVHKCISRDGEEKSLQRIRQTTEIVLSYSPCSLKCNLCFNSKDG